MIESTRFRWARNVIGVGKYAMLTTTVIVLLCTWMVGRTLSEDPVLPAPHGGAEIAWNVAQGNSSIQVGSHYPQSILRLLDSQEYLGVDAAQGQNGDWSRFTLILHARPDAAHFVSFLQELKEVEQRSAPIRLAVAICTEKSEAMSFALRRYVGISPSIIILSPSLAEWYSISNRPTLALISPSGRVVQLYDLVAPCGVVQVMDAIMTTLEGLK